MEQLMKAEYQKINISKLSKNLPDLKNTSEPKAMVIGKWFANVIDNSSFSAKTLLPTKAELAYLFGVSIGTMQCAMRYLEDLKYVESKQNIGTFIKLKDEKNSVRKLTSTRDIAADRIKQYIKLSNLAKGEFLPKISEIAKIIKYSEPTTRAAIRYLVIQGILEYPTQTRTLRNGKLSGYMVKTLDFTFNSSSDNNEPETLVSKIEKDLIEYIQSNKKVGDRLPSISELSVKFFVSPKTIFDALKQLSNQGIVISMRGRYGTVVSRMPNDEDIPIIKEKSIFAPAQDAMVYHYQKTQNQIRNMILDNYSIGDKLPSIKELSQTLDLNTNTIQRAIHNLSNEGYLKIVKGRFGGIFVIDLPEESEQTYKWIAINKEN